MINLPFINWREEPGLPGMKPRKVPFSVANNKRIDPHDPTNHLTFEQVSATGYPIGVVLSDNDPYFLLDIDDCLLPDGQWHSGAVATVHMFPGAACEVSRNGKGLHIMGRCGPMGPRKHKWNADGIGFEFYTSGRFVALGQGLRGNIDLDWTYVLDKFVPHASAPVDVPQSNSVAPEYTGPEDDDQLIALMLAAKGSTAQMFGDKASVSDLWNRNVSVLSRVFPSASGEEFDASSADAALMSHLAFYTGRNAERMDRLFRRSALVREKYIKRPDYQTSTISHAVNGCRAVYDKPRAPASTTGAISGSSILSIADQTRHFDGCVYVTDDHSVMVPGGYLLKPAQFKAIFGGYEFIMSGDGTRPTFNAFEAFTENRVARFPKVKRTRFKPGLPHGALLDPRGMVVKDDVMIADGVNVFEPVDIPTRQGDVSLFLDLVGKLLPVERDRTILLSWMAAVTQYPGKKFLWSPVLQGTKGNGKSAIGEILYYCVGERYSWKVAANKIDARFNTYLQNRLFIYVEEMHMFNKYEMLETLKDYITGTRQEVEGKGTNSTMDVDYCANWLFCTNHRDAVIKERDDRRFAVFFTAQQSREDMARDGMLTGDYFPKLWDWLRAEGYAAIRSFLMNYRIPAEFNPADRCFMAPDTSSTLEAIEASHGVAEQYIMEAVGGDEAGFRGGWISTWAAAKMLKDHGVTRSPRKLAAVLEGLGYINRGRCTKPLMQEGGTRPTLYSLPDVAIDYEVAQGWIRPTLSAAQ